MSERDLKLCLRSLVRAASRVPVGTGIVGVGARRDGRGYRRAACSLLHEAAACVAPSPPNRHHSPARRGTQHETSKGVRLPCAWTPGPWTLGRRPAGCRQHGEAGPGTRRTRDVGWVVLSARASPAGSSSRLPRADGAVGAERTAHAAASPLDQNHASCVDEAASVLISLAVTISSEQGCKLNNL